MFAGKSLGVKYRADGYTPKKPVMIIPGLCSSCLKVVQSPYEPWIGKRIWLSMSSIGFDKMWDVIFLGKKKKVKGTPQGEEKMADVDEGLKRRWMQHMCLADDGVSDPEGIKLRPVKGLKGCKYLDPGAITDALSYVMGPLAEMLEDLGYTDGHNLDAAPYDWRLPPCKLEERDGYFTELKNRIEKMYNDNGEQKVVIIAHSLGNRVTHYFTRFCEAKFGRQWVSKHIDNWLAIGPLWLGAPKLLRAMISGDRMGLEAFLYPPEGIQLGRSLGSTAWMFPYISPSDHEFATYSKLKDEKTGKFVDKSNKDILIEGGARQVYERYRDYYEGDPLYGKQEDVLAAPPIDNIYAIYGINLKTETFYFFKECKAKKKVSDFVPDGTGKIGNFKCEGGIAYETKNTKQNVLKGQKRGGDGTVPYPSLSYCKKWKGSVNVKVAEIEGAEHREILKNKTFLQLVLEYVSQAPPPTVLPVTFSDIEYPVNYELKGKQQPRILSLDKQYIRIKQTSGKGEVRKYYENVSNIILDEQNGNSFFIEFEDQTKASTFYSDLSATIVQEIAARCNFITEFKATYTEDRNEYGQTVLHTTVLSNNLTSIMEVIKGPVDVNAVDLNGNTPLITAAEKGYFDIMIALLQLTNINVNKQANNSKSVMHHMCALRLSDSAQTQKWENVMEKLLGLNADLNAPGEFGETPLHIAVKRGNYEVIHWLLTHNAQVNATNNVGETALHYAIRIARKDIIEILLKHGADRHKEAQSTGTPLVLANKTDPALMAYIRDFVSGANANRASQKPRTRDTTKIPVVGGTRDEHGRTPLHVAADEDKLDSVFELLLQNANVNDEDKNGWTPLHSAAAKGYIDVLTVLMNAYGVNVNAQTDSGSTVLHYLMRIQVTEANRVNLSRVLEQLKVKGGSLNTPASRGITPLHEAALRGNLDGLRWLIEQGAKINAVSSIGMNAIHFAVQAKSLEAVKLLVEAGCSIHQKAEAGGTPAEMAKGIDQNIYNYLNTVPTTQGSIQPPPRSNLSRQSSRPPVKPPPPSRAPSTETTTTVEEEDDEEEVIYSKDDDDDDEQVPGSTTAVIPLAQRRRTMLNTERAATFSVIFTKPPIGGSVASRGGITPPVARGRGGGPPGGPGRGAPPAGGKPPPPNRNQLSLSNMAPPVVPKPPPISRANSTSTAMRPPSDPSNLPQRGGSVRMAPPSHDSPPPLQKPVEQKSPNPPPRASQNGQPSPAPQPPGPGGPRGRGLPPAGGHHPSPHRGHPGGAGGTPPAIPPAGGDERPRGGSFRGRSPALQTKSSPVIQTPQPPATVAQPAAAEGGGTGTKFCIECGTKRVPGFKFCGECGHKFLN